MKEEIKLGRYRHYKGNEYEVLYNARHSETEEEMVVYRRLYCDVPELPPIADADSFLTSGKIISFNCNLEALDSALRRAGARNG